jgi:hypothetical protein
MKVRLTFLTHYSEASIIARSISSFDAKALLTFKMAQETVK